MFGFKVIRQYEQGLVFRWGRVLPGLREPGLTWINPREEQHPGNAVPGGDAPLLRSDVDPQERRRVLEQVR
jgi:hypothetical protein